MDGQIGIGVIGCGGFGLFALQHFVQLEGVRLAAMAGTHREAATTAVHRFGLREVIDIAAMVADPAIDLVYIATPPFLHHSQAMMALRAGKHVICEKPLALTLEQASEMIAAARQNKLLLIANLMQRYNPLVAQVKELIDRHLLGDFLYGHFENLASDEGLDEHHWFWDRSKSGGIFVEHGVHFFDLFEHWLGPARLVSARRGLRPGTSFEEHVLCTLEFGENALVTIYHGFHQPNRLDRQEIRLVFERGELRLFEWVPMRLTLTAVADEAQTRALTDLLPGARLDVVQGYPAKDRACRGRHRSIDASQLIEMHYGEQQRKMPLYGELLRMMLDQLAWIRDPDHQRIVTEQNGYRSLAIALQADALAEQIANARQDQL